MSTINQYIVRGHVIDSVTKRPLPGLHIRAYDKDLIWDDCLGSDQTGRQGDFTIRFFEHDFKEPLEGVPEIYVVVYGPTRKELHRTEPIRPNKGQTEIHLHVPVDVGPWATDPRISYVEPQAVRPGTFIEIHGDNFGNRYGDVTVTIGGREALVLTVTPQKLTVRIPPERGALDPLVVAVAGKTATTNGLHYADPPRQGQVGTLGAPATFSGAEEEGAGLNPTGTAQRVLIIMCHPSDKAPTIGGLTAAAERQRQIDAFEKLVNPGCRQMSFNQTDFDFDYTDWLALPETDDFYFWRQADIDAAQDVIDNLPPDATEAEQDAAQAALATAQAKRNLMQESDELYHDALKAARDAGWTLTDYAGIMLCLATDHLRGQSSGRHNEKTDSDGDTVTLAPSTNLWIISYTSHWGRRIHELAHAIASSDLYNDTGVIADGEDWDMMGDHNRMPLFSGYNIVDRLAWYGAANVKTYDWTSAPQENEVVTLRAHDTTQDALANVFHIIKINIFPGLTYYVEVRQEPDPLPADLNTTSDSPAALPLAAAVMDANPNQLLFDTHVVFPGAEPAYKGGVIVTKMVDDTSNLNQKIRTITLLSPELMQAGDEVVDAARRLTIRVEAKTNDRPLTYQIRVQWVEVATADPNGLFNVRIRPWDSSWQTNDIWIDSAANAWGTYETALEPATGNPTGNGDRPWVGNWNRIYACVHNFGIVDVNDVQVTFYVNSPPAIGDNGTWVPHAVRTIPTIAAGSSENVYTTWYPVVGEHTCLKVATETQIGETDVADNDAQENVFNFDTSGASPHQPIFFEVSVQNPLSEWALIHMHPRGLRPGWESTTEHGWVWLPPLGEKKMKVALFTDIGRATPLTRSARQRKGRVDIRPEISFKLDGAVYTWYGEGPNVNQQAEHLAAIGGIQVQARARRLVELFLAADRQAAERGLLIARGGIDAKIAGVDVKLKVTAPNGRHYVVALQTDAEGRFQYNARQFDHQVGQGKYTLQAFILGDEVVADAESGVVNVEVKVPIIE